MRMAFAAASAGAAALYALAWAAVMPSLVDLSTMQTVLRDHFNADDHGHYDGYTREFGDFTLHRARELGAYASARRSATPLRVVAATPPAGRGRPSLDVDLYGGERVASMTGSMAGEPLAVVLWLEGNAGAYRTNLATLRYYGGPGVGARTAFRGTVSLAGLPSGTYRVGYADDSGTGVDWTAGRLAVR